MPREIRDPVHGFVERRNDERLIIDTPIFQRLRGIKQLAMAHLVYPGSLHTRFDHSIGVMHVAGRIAHHVGLDSERVAILRLAALLHDIGHGPFSHVSEDVLDAYPDEKKYKRVPGSKIAEVISWEIIKKNSELSKHISETHKEQIVDVLSGNGGTKLEQEIISGPLDADKQDYVLRDSYFCGVKYGVFDLERLIGTLEKYSQDGTERLVGSTDGLYGIEQFVIAKYHLTWQVYRHKIRLITDNMIVRALQLGIENDKIPFLLELYRYDGSDAFIENYLAWDDARLITSILHGDFRSTECATIFRKLYERVLFKRILNENVREMADDPLKRKWLSDFGKERDYKGTPIEKRQEITATRRSLERDIAKFISEEAQQEIRPEHVIINQYPMKSVREQARNKKLPILIRKGSTLVDFEEVSLMFGSIDKNLSEEFFDVYAPVYIRDDEKRRLTFRKLADGIKAIVLQAAPSSDVKEANSVKEANKQEKTNGND